jgi:tRNA pseudouridine32 synthase/23S rRNA pseudouridine746 synthase
VEIPVVYEDADVVAAMKPEGIASIPERDPARPSVLRALSERRGERLYVVHRLDKDVSGVLLFARHADAHRHLNLEFDARRVRKEYLAVVHGVVVPDAGTVDRPLRIFGSGRTAPDPVRGKPSRTDYRVLERARAHTLLLVEPRTGRRHQIRAHLYAIGHPVAGDPRYGDPAANRGIGRLMLHAHRLVVRLPSGADVAIEAPPPASFLEVWGRLRG